MVDSLSRFAEYIETSELNLPSSTIAFEEEGKVSWNTNQRFNIDGGGHRGFPTPGVDSPSLEFPSLHREQHSSTGSNMSDIPLLTTQQLMFLC